MACEVPCKAAIPKLKDAVKLASPDWSRGYTTDSSPFVHRHFGFPGLSIGGGCVRGMGNIRKVDSQTVRQIGRQRKMSVLRTCSFLKRNTHPGDTTCTAMALEPISFTSHNKIVRRQITWCFWGKQQQTSTLLSRCFHFGICSRTRSLTLLWHCRHSFEHVCSVTLNEGMSLYTPRGKGGC